MLRRIFIIIAGLLALVIVLLVSLPFWFGSALGVLAPRWGLTFGEYTRLGYDRFALTNLEYRQGPFRATATRVELESPITWLSHRFEGEGAAVVVERWLVESLGASDTTPPPEERGTGGWIPLRQQIRDITAQADAWISSATIGPGVVRWPGGEISLAGIAWQARTLTLDQLAFKDRVIDAMLTIPAKEDELSLRARTSDTEASLALVSRGETVAGELAWWNQGATLTADFEPRGWIPGHAEVVIDEGSVPAEKLKLENLYASVMSRGHIEWRDGSYTLNITTRSTPLPEGPAPPIDIALRARGNLEAVTVDEFAADLPGANAHLSTPVTIGRSGEFQEEAARFTTRVDLAQVPWIAANGFVDGEAHLMSGLSASPVIEFNLQARDVTAEGVSLESADLNGSLEWPRIHIAEATIAGRDGEKLRADGGWNFQTSEVIDATIEGVLQRATFARWLPENIQFTTVAIDASADGPIAEINHAGSANVEGVTIGPVKPIDAALTWRGVGMAAEHIAADIVAGASRLSFEGSSDASAAQLTAFEFAPGESTPVRLTGPALIRWRPTPGVESFHLSGGGSGVDVNLTWGEAGDISLALREIPSSWLADFITLPGPAWNLASLAITGSWDNGPMKFEAAASGGAELREDRVATVNLDLRGDSRGMRLAALRAAESGETIVNATGRIPATLTPAGSELLHIDPEGAVEVQARTAENAAFWDQLGAMTGVHLKAPRISADVTGTWQQPQGIIEAGAEQVTVEQKEGASALPAIDDLTLALSGDLRGVSLDQFAVQIEGQPLRASGRLPLPEDGWAAVIKEPLMFARRDAEFQLEIPQMKIAAFSEMLPENVVPQGTLEANVTFSEGELSGGLRLDDAATRPIGGLGALHEISANVGLAGEVIELRSLSAHLGGEEVRIEGEITLPALAFAAGATPGTPTYNVTVQARNLPLVRRMGLLVRADLDLALKSSDDPVPRVSGTVVLRDSLFLQDVRALIPSGTRGASTRPPYFEVEAEPFKQWQLDVAVTGEEFMRLRTTLFNGTASADFQISGTLGEPIMTGDATIDRGKVQLPFATFEVQEGRVSLTAAQPHEPDIWLTARTRRYGYDLQMELSGNASSPALTFESTPPLENAQVLLMVMAGVVPDQALTVTTQQRATRLGSYLGRSLLSGLGDADDTSRLTITSGEDISQRGRETYGIEYGLNDRWSLTAEYDKYDTQSLGVKWQAYARGGSPDQDEDAAKDEDRSRGAGEATGEDDREPAEMNVEGLGWFSDLQMESSLKRLLGNGSNLVLDTHEIEDAMFLLLSAVQQEGYLRPVIQIEVTHADGTTHEFTVDADLDMRIPRDLAARAVTFQVEQGTWYSIDELEISGLHAMEEEAARAYFTGESALFKRKAARRYTPNRLQSGVASLEAALRQDGYAEANVQAAEPQIDHATGAVALSIEVDEGPRWEVATIDVEGEVKGEAAAVTNAADFARFIGKPWSEAVGQDIAADLRKRLLEQGYADARVSTSHTARSSDAGKAVDVRVSVNSGPRITIGEVRFEGHVRTKESVLHRRVSAEPGDPLDPIALQQARHRIARLGVFEEVDLHFEPAEGPVRDAVYVLEPGRQMELNLLAGYNTYEQLRAGLEMRQYNLWGRAHRTRLLLVQSLKSTRGEYEYTVPELFGESVTGTARLFGLQREEVAFLRQEYGAEFRVDAPLRFLGANANAGYTFEVLRNRDNELETRGTDAEQVEVGSFEFGLTRDRRDNPLLAREGYRWYSRIEAARPAFGGSAAYERIEFGGTYHRPVGTGRWMHFGLAHGVLTTIGTTDERLPVNKRFFPGGDGSIRGYTDGEAAPRAPDGRFIGAKSYLSATIEFEQAIVGQLSAVVFVDALGTARQLADYPFDETLFAAGLGLRYQTVIGPIRAEYGHNLTRRDGDPAGTFLFSIGFPF